MSKALDNGIAVLEYISSKRACTVTETAKALGLNKSTVSRIIRTFMRRDFVEYNRNSRMYSVGPAILQMSNRYVKTYNTMAQIKSAMEALSVLLGESVHLCALTNDAAVVVEQVESDNKLAVNAKIGNREPLHASAVGKCLLAFASPEETEAMLKNIRYERFTENTITEEKSFLAELGRIRERGYSIDDGELTPDIRCVAVPVFNPRGKCIYSLGVSGSGINMTDERIRMIIEKMTAAIKP